MVVKLRYGGSGFQCGLELNALILSGENEVKTFLMALGTSK